MRRNIKKAVTLLEIIVVAVVIGVLATLSLPNLFTARERALDKEALANLKLVQAAQRIYRMGTGQGFFPVTDSDQNTAAINTNLRLDLSTRNWNYVAGNDCSNGTCLDVRAARSSPPAGWTRSFYINQNLEEACCCPATSACFSADQCPAKGFNCAWYP